MIGEGRQPLSRWLAVAVAALGLTAALFLLGRAARDDRARDNDGIVVLVGNGPADREAPAMDTAFVTSPVVSIYAPSATGPVPPPDTPTESGAIRGSPDRTGPPTTANGGIGGDPEAPPESGIALPAP